MSSEDKIRIRAEVASPDPDRFVFELGKRIEASCERLAREIAHDTYGPLTQGPLPVPGWPGAIEPPIPWWRRVWDVVVRFRWRVFPYYLRHIDEDREDDE